MRPSFHRLFAASICALPLIASGRLPAETVTLNGLRVTLDDATGNLLKLEFDGVGTLLEPAAGEGGLLDVAYPVQDFVALRLGTRYSRASAKRDGDAIVLEYAPLAPSRTNVAMPEGTVKATITIKPAADKRSVILQAKIVNGSKGLIPQVLFPDLRGLRAVGTPAATQLRLPGNYPAHPFTEDPVPPHAAQYYVNSGWKEYPPSVGYYGANTLRWLDWGSGAGGLSVFERAWGTGVRPTLRTHRSQSHPDTIRLMWDHNVRVEPGATWESSEFWLTPHRGGWAKGIEPFRTYARSQMPQRPPLPPTVSANIGFQTVWMIQSPEKDPKYASFRFTDLPRIAEDAKAHGINQLVLWGWCQYFELPWKLRTECGTVEEFVDAVKKCKEMGVVVSPFVSCYLLQSKHAERYGGSQGNPAWVYHPDMVPMMDPYYLHAGYPVQFWSVFSINPTNKNYHADVLAAFREWADRGVTSWSWDQVFADKPGTGGLTDLLLEVRTMLREKDPQQTFSGEQVTTWEWDQGLLDYTWNWTDHVDCTPASSVLRTPRPNCNIEDSPRIVKAGAIDNMFLNVMPRKPDQPNGTALISDKPALSAAVREVAKMRAAYLDFFAEGTLLGESVLTEPAPAFVRAYHLAGKPGTGWNDWRHRDHLLIFVMNNQAGPARIDLSTQLDLWLPPARTYTLQLLSSTGALAETWTHETPALRLTTRELAPLEIAVYDIQAETQE